MLTPKHRIWLRSLSLLLVLALVFQLLPTGAWAAETTGQETLITEPPAPAEPAVIGEVTEYRALQEKHFRMSDGSFLAVDYGVPVHYASSEESWADIDNTLTLHGGTQSAPLNAQTTPGQYVTQNGGEVRAFAENLSTGFLFSASTGEGGVALSLPTGQTDGDAGLMTTNAGFTQTFNPTSSAQITYPDDPNGEDSVALLALFADEEELTLGQQITPSRLRTQVVYADVFSGVDLLYELYSYNVKETILVKNPLDSYAFTFLLTLDGLTPNLEEDGSIVLSDAEQEAVYFIPAPYMVDAAGAYSEDVHYTLTNDEGDIWLLTVTADEDWMEQESRAFPIAIDPTIVQKNLYDTFHGTVCSENNNFYSENDNYACGYHPDFGKMEMYFRVPSFPAVPAGFTMTRAQVGFYQNDYRPSTNATSGDEIVLYMSAIEEETTLDSTLLWANRPDLGPVLDYVETDAGGINDYLFWDITPAAKAWQDDPESKFGLAMTSNALLATAHRAWFSGKTYAIISYRNTNGLEGYYTYATAGVGNAGTAYISDYTGQLTLSKALVSYASTVNPFVLELYYNSGYAMTYGETNYDVGGNMGLAMHVGAGFGLNIMQHIKKETLPNDAVSDGETTYLVYTDGDGTKHYFAKDSGRNNSFYYDEDGLGMKIWNTSGETYLVYDDDGTNTSESQSDYNMRFVNGHLSEIRDDNNNKIKILYTTNANGSPALSGDKISKVVQQNNGGSAITVATFGYDGNYLRTVTDAAGIVYTLTHTTGDNNGKLASIKRGSQVIAQYSTDSTRMTYAYDAEVQQGIRFAYTGGQISKYWEYTASGETGVTMEISHPENGQTVYRSYGIDQVKNGNDILTYYTFDYAGRSVNAYTTDLSGNILGASNMVYTGIGTTDMTNNRTLRTASIGAAAMNELRNYGFELTSPAWSFTGANATNTNILSKAENPRTGLNALKGWIKAGNTSTISAKRTVTLAANTTYTLSAYVNTAQCTSFGGDGVYLRVSGNGIDETSEKLNYRTSTAVDGGWVRLSVTFTTGSSGSYTIGVYNHGASPYFFADDFQLEQAETPANLNLLENGNLQAGNYNWSYITLAGYTSGVGLFSTDTGARSLRLGGDAYTIVRASQVVPINETGGSYVFSGWAKANAVPDNLEENADPAQDTWKEFCLRAIVTYSDGSTEYHYVPFNSDVTQWQFSSLTIVPKKATTKVATIEVQCVYDKNDNEAYFDNLSLVKEAAQTMAYDENGNLESVQASGSEGESAEYEDGNLTSVTTGGSGTFTYTYDDKDNVATASNGIVKETYTRDSYGNVTSSTMTPDSGSGLTMTSSATYTNGGNLVYTQTDTRGNTVTNSYYNVATGKYDLNYMLGAPYMTTDPQGNKQYYIYDSATGRYQMTYINGVVSTQNNYNERGLLASVTRAGYYDNNGVNTRVTQDYAMTYDAYGNTTKIEVGTSAGKITLGSYTYAPNNGVLQRMSYGNGDYTDYTYDELGRTSQVSTSDGGLYTYVYTGDGQLFSISDLTNNLTYRYNYDTLGRLIGSSTSDSEGDILRIQAHYDENSRLSGQSWQMGDKTYSEGFVYDDHGRLTSKSVTLANGSTSTMTNTYDALSRLSAQTRPMSRITYSYLAGANGTTTGLVSSVTHSKVGSNSFSPITFGYAYDELGYITSYTQTGKQAVTYDYDVQGQLTSVSDPNQDLYYSYEYDTYGNIRSAEAHGSYHTSDNYTNNYAYENPKWLDLLTGFNDEPILYEGQTLVDGEIVGDPTSGNPISYFNGTRWEFVWENGRQLASASTTDGDTTIDIDYTYDINGLRTSKTITRTTGGGTAHTHEYTSAVTAPTCTTAGYTTYTCDCGESYVDNLVDALGHNYVQSGNVYTCSRCGDSYTGHEHSYTETTTEPTCLTAGYTVYTCSCGDSYTVDIPALGHNYVLVNQTGNVATYECSRCGHRYSAVIPIDPNPPVEYGLRNGNVTVTTEHHEYIYASGKLLREVITTTDAEGNVTTETLDFTYDASGSPYTVTRIVGTSSSTYYYVVNAQGDIIRVVNASGMTVAEYAYDPWGRVNSASGTMAEVNPLRYRGYYYDAETEFYYLQSRYYDPAICRFINGDGYASTGQGFLGQNMFSYCCNCPILFSDPAGRKVVIDLSSFSSEEISLIMSYVCRLSDDIICLDGNQLKIVALRNGNKSDGTQLIRELLMSQHTISITVFIEEVNAEEQRIAEYHKDAAYIEGRNGRMTNTLANVPSGGEIQLDISKLSNEPCPTIAFGHELIHAWHFANDYAMLDDPNDKVGPFPFINEEAYTVGLTFWLALAYGPVEYTRYISTYTENNLRAEHGLTYRIWYP